MTSFQSLALSCHFLFYGEQMCLPLWLTWAQWSEDAGKQEETEGIYKVQAPCHKSHVGNEQIILVG